MTVHFASRNSLLVLGIHAAEGLNEGSHEMLARLFAVANDFDASILLVA